MRSAAAARTARFALTTPRPEGGLDRMTSCLCAAGPTRVTDDPAGETVCRACGTVLEEKTMQAGWNGAAVRAGRGWRGRIARYAITKYTITMHIAYRPANAGRDALLRTVVPMLEHVCAPGYVADEAVALVRRMSSDGFARGRPRQVLCAGTVLVACRVHGRTVRREEVAEITCTDCKAVSRVARMIMERYGLEPASVEERTRRILSRMCADIDEPGLVRRVLRTYDSVLSAGMASGRSPYVTAACIMRIHTRRFMPEARLAVAVGVPMASMRRYAAEMAPHALSGASGFGVT